MIEDASVVRDLCLLQKALSEARIVVLSELELPDNVIGALRHGVAGYLPTSLSPELTAEAIRLVLAGGVFIPASALRFVLTSERPRTEGLISGADGAVASLRFTLRQNQVLRHLWRGAQNKVIARELGMSERTVKVHLKHLMKKLHVHNRTQVALITQHMFGES